MSELPVALVADIHGNLPALEAVVDDIARRGVDRIVNLGDLVSGPLWPRETAAFLMRQSWVTVAGNHDRMVSRDDPATHAASDRHAYQRLTVDQRAWLAALPPTAAIDDGRLLLCHGTPASDTAYLIDTVEHGRLRGATPDEVAGRIGSVAADVIACGHSHAPRLLASDAGRLFVNPGAVGVQAYTDREEPEHVSENGSPFARYALLERRDDTGAGGKPRWSVTFVAVPYDHLRASAEAARNGRQDWAFALRTGYAG
jgi:predicted phosphodiesterase